VHRENRQQLAHRERLLQHVGDLEDARALLARGGNHHDGQIVELRRESLDHLIILSQTQLRYVLAEYALSHFNSARPHEGIGQRIPVLGERVRTRFAGLVTACPVLGGLHYYRAAA